MHDPRVKESTRQCVAMRSTVLTDFQREKTSKKVLDRNLIVALPLPMPMLIPILVPMSIQMQMQMQMQMQIQIQIQIHVT